MFAKGLGVPEDIVQAYMWFKLAAAQGYPDGTERMDFAASRMTPDQIAEAERLVPLHRGFDRLISA